MTLKMDTVTVEATGNWESVSIDQDRVVAMYCPVAMQLRSMGSVVQLIAGQWMRFPGVRVEADEAMAAPAAVTNVLVYYEV